MNALLRHIRAIREWHAVIVVAILLAIASLTPAFCARPNDPVQLLASAAHRQEDSRVTLVAIDRGAITELGPWPWGAATISKILDGLSLGNARLVLMDPVVAGGVTPQAARAFRTRDGAPWLVAGYAFHASLGDLPEEYDSTKGRAETQLAKRALPAQPGDDSTLVTVAGLAETEAATEGSLVGFSNLFPDANGIVRSQPLAVRLGHRAYPSLALGAAATAAEITPLITESPSGRPEGVSVGDRHIGTGTDARMYIDYALCPHEGDTVSALDLHEGTFPAEAINGRIVVLGATEPTLAKMRRTPIGRLPEASIYACQLAQIESDRGFRYFAGQPWTSAAIAIAALVYLVALMRLGLGRRAVAVAAASVAAIVAGVVLCASSGFMLPAAHFALTLIILWLASLAWQAAAVEMPARASAAAFAGRISPELLRRAARDPRSFAPEGPARQLVAITLDIRGFGTISRSLGEASCPFLRRFRTLVAKPLIRNGAFIDSWSADECRAAFGALAPHEGMAQAACGSAVAILHAISQARRELQDAYGVSKPRLGIGIWHGEASAGDLGPAGAHGFGVAGPAMEAAATLRALNRTYRTSVLVSDEIARAAENSFRFRPLDPVALHSSERPVVIHELVGEIGIILPQLATYLAGRSAYLKGDFERAAQIFGEILSEHPHDGPSQLFLRRSKSLLKSPPKAEWLGIWQP